MLTLKILRFLRKKTLFSKLSLNSAYVMFFFTFSKKFSQMKTLSNYLISQFKYFNYYRICARSHACFTRSFRHLSISYSNPFPPSVSYPHLCPGP